MLGALIREQMSIQTATPNGNLVSVYNEQGQIIFSVPLGPEPEDGLVGYTASAVSVRRGFVVNTYDERGQIVRSVPVISRKRFENSDPPLVQKRNVPAEPLPRHFEESPPPGTNDPPNRLFLVMAAAALAIAIFSPGLVAVAGLKSLLSLSLETGQMWAFGIACSALVWAAFYLVSRDFRKASMRYLVLCAGVVVLFLFCHFGLKTPFTEQTFRLYFPAHR